MNKLETSPTGGRAARGGPSPLAWSRRLQATLLAVGLTTLVLTPGCRRPAPTQTLPPTQSPAPVTAPPSTATVTGTSQVTATAIARRQVISFTRQVVGFPERVDARPGPWSPNGQVLVAYVIVRQSGLTGPVGHLWTVNALAGQPLWDSGDMEGPLRAGPMADWLADGTLVLARQDGMLVRPDGSRLVDALPGLVGQPKTVSVAPDGRAWFIDAPDASWLAERAGARAVSNRPPSGFDAWSWRSDSRALALSAPGGEYFVLDVTTATVSKIAEAPPLGGGERLPPPRWLADGMVFLSAATETTFEGAPAYVNRVVDPETTRATPLNDLLGAPPNAWLPDDGSAWVSPDGSHVLYPQYEWSAAGEVTLMGSWLYDVTAGQAQRIEPASDPVWSPAGDRFAYRLDDGLAVWHVASATSLLLAESPPPVTNYSWSPDGRWILYQDADAALWIVSADRRAGPERVADEVLWEPGPSWSADGRRFAASLADGGAPPRLELVTVELYPPGNDS